MDNLTLKHLHELHHQGDLEMLLSLRQHCEREDVAEVDLLIYLNDTVGIGWGEPSGPEHEKEFKEREDEYFERKFALLKKYDSADSWLND